jgi:bacterial/archaeal transporter family-2 protein
MSKAIPLLAALVVGMAIATQGVVNSELSQHVGQVRAVAISIAVSVIVVLILLLVHPVPGSFAGVTHAPPWAFIGGLLGVGILIGTITAVPRIGVATTTAAVLAAQMITSAMIDQFGLLGVAARPVTPTRFAGLVLAVFAVLLITRR